MPSSLPHIECHKCEKVLEDARNADPAQAYQILRQPFGGYTK